MALRYVTLEEAAEILRDDRFANWVIPAWPEDAIGQLCADVIIVIGMSRAEAYAALGPIMWDETIKAVREMKLPTIREIADGRT